MLILFKHHRTLDIVKTVINEKSYVYSKTDQIIHLSKDGKLEEVICVFLFKSGACLLTSNPTGVALENFYFSLFTLVMAVINLLCCCFTW